MSEKYQREIEDILGGIEGAPPGQPKRKKRGPVRGIFALLGRVFGGRGGWFSPGRVMLTALTLLLVALLFKASIPGFIVPMLLWAAVIVFILGYALFFINANEPYEKRWRERPVEGPPSYWARWRRWVRGRR